MQPTVERCEGRALLSTGSGAASLLKIDIEQVTAARRLPDDIIDIELGLAAGAARHASAISYQTGGSCAGEVPMDQISLALQRNPVRTASAFAGIPDDVVAGEDQIPLTTRVFPPNFPNNF